MRGGGQSFNHSCILMACFQIKSWTNRQAESS